MDQPASPRGGEAGDVAQEVDDDGRDRTDLDHGGEPDDPVVRDVDPEQTLGDLEVPGGGDGQELGEPLHHAEDHRLPGVDASHGAEPSVLHLPTT